MDHLWNRLMDFWNRVQPNELKTRVWFWELEFNQLQTLILPAQITPERPQIILDHPKRFPNDARIENVSVTSVTISFHCLHPKSESNSELRIEIGFWHSTSWNLSPKIIRVHMTTVSKHAIVDILAVFQLQPLKLYLILKLNFVSRLCL